MKTGTTIISLICFLTFGAFAGMAQTLTSTFQFTGSGTIGTQTFTNAAITITTIGSTAAVSSQSEGNSAPGTNLRYSLINTSASISISGIGTSQFTVPTNITSTPPTGGGETILFGIGTSMMTAMEFSFPALPAAWNMLNSIGPFSGYVLVGWSGTTTTNNGVVNIYDETWLPGTFQATVSGTATPPPLTLSRVGVLSHIAAGGWWSTVITLINTSTTSELITVTFHNDGGSAMTLPVTTTLHGTSQTTTTSSVNATINPNATLLISMGDPAAATAVGWADVLGSGPIGGYAIFRETPSTQSSEGTVPLQSQFPTTFTLPYDNSSGFVMGVALANLSTSFANITATMWDANGNQLGAQTITIPGNGHTSFVLPTELPLTAGKLGIVKFQATGGIAGLGLRFSQFGTFTSVPTM